MWENEQETIDRGYILVSKLRYVVYESFFFMLKLIGFGQSSLVRPGFICRSISNKSVPIFCRMQSFETCLWNNHK
jgi:hypothetical protein